MKTILIAVLALMASVAYAEPRGTATMGAEPLPDTPMDAFLGRMVDKFKFDGAVHFVGKDECQPACESVQGTADCVTIGDGPGVQCILNAKWIEMWDIVLQQSAEEGGPVDDTPTGIFEMPGGIPYLDPAMALFGLDPGHEGISYLLVNNKGMPEGGLGYIKGNRLAFWTKCVNGPSLLNAMNPKDINGRRPDTCDRKVLIEAKPDSKVVWWTIEIAINDEVYTRFTLTLRRQEREEADGKPAKS